MNIFIAIINILHQMKWYSVIFYVVFICNGKLAVNFMRKPRYSRLLKAIKIRIEMINHSLDVGVNALAHLNDNWWQRK